MADTNFFTTNYGPLTTVFTPPSSCLGIRIQLRPVDTHRPKPDSSAVTSGSTIQRFAWGHGCGAAYTNSSWQASATRGISCFPSTPKNAPPTGDADFTVGIYSPGLVCPSGWIADCAVAYTSTPPPFDASPALNRLWSVLKSGETFVGCCPPDYGCNTFNNIWNGGLLCGVATRGGLESVTLYNEQCSTTPKVIMLDKTIDSMALLPAVHMIIPSGSTYGVPSAATATSSNELPTSTEASQDPNTPAGETKGLSLRAKVAIGIVVPVVAIAISLAVFIWLFRRRAMRQRDGQNDNNTPELHAEGIMEISDDRNARSSEVLGSAAFPIELPADVMAQELAGTNEFKVERREEKLVGPENTARKDIRQ